MTVPDKGFISYAHDDHAMFAAFRRHLRATETQLGITFWADTGIKAGYRWDQEIADHIAEAHVFLLLVSADSLCSDYIFTREKPAIEQRCDAVHGLILPVVLRRCAWGMAAGALQAVPTANGRLRPIADWHPHNNGHDRARQQIEQAIAGHYGVALPSAA